MRKKILVCSPSFVTGGPELLHQLVRVLVDQGCDAYICYFPFEEDLDTPNQYEHYRVKKSRFIDNDDVVIVVPETATWITRKIKNAEIYVWWLSVDNYYNRAGDSFLYDVIGRFITFNKRVSLSRLKKYKHLVQSYYAERFLLEHGIISEQLYDYISDVHFSDDDFSDLKENIVAYNPKKGRKRMAKLISENDDIRFVPIQNLSSTGVFSLLKKSKIYIDFGGHPGKDRIPREAALARCCVITGKRGSAGNPIDLSIPEEFKVDDTCSSNLVEVRELIDRCFEDYEYQITKFSSYRDKIIAEKSIFINQARKIFYCHK